MVIVSDVIIPSTKYISCSSYPWKCQKDQFNINLWCHISYCNIYVICKTWKILKILIKGITNYKYTEHQKKCGAIVVVIVWLLDLHLCKQCLSPLKLWIWTLFMARCTPYSIMWSSLSVICSRSVVFSGYSDNEIPPPIKLIVPI